MISENIAKGIVKFKSKYLILRCNFQCRDESYNGKWELHGGRIGKESPEEAIIREVKEEIGLNVEILKKIDVFKIKQDNRMINCHLFLLKSNAEKIKISQEHIDYRWVKQEGLEKFELVPLLEELKENLTKPL